jgi:pyruvate-formate lyase-activating enzyme
MEWMHMLTALYADKRGEIYDAPGYQAVGRVGKEAVLLVPEDMIPLPEGSELMYLPGRKAAGALAGSILPMDGSFFAVAAMLPAGYTRTHLPEFIRQPDAPVLPLFGYTAVALYKDAVYAAAVASDDNTKWQPGLYNTRNLKKKIAQVRQELAGNRIMEQLAHCSLQWHCSTAQNLFYHRWEAGIPVSPACNANCFGCISLQASECCPSPQSRIRFTPTPEEIAAVGIYHLATAPDAIVSFGQGCEGEPSLAADSIAAAIAKIRRATSRGNINMNTNAGFTDGVRAIVDAGLDSMRVSIISAIPDTYQAYYRSQYTLAAVRESIGYAKQHGVYVSLNMLAFPGLNDRPEELAAWEEFIGQTHIDMIQLRNLTIDPDAFLDIMPESSAPSLGVKPFIRHLAERFPDVTIGSFSRYIK